MGIRKAVIDGGVSYHHGLMQAGEPFADFEWLDILTLASHPLEEYDLLVVPRSTDSDMLVSRRYQIRRFLDRGGVLITFGEQPGGWLPGCRWEPECAEDVGTPVISADHAITAGLGADELEWHPRLTSWCCHGHFIAPTGAEVLVANQRGDAWLYIDRQTTRGVILASSNLDPDTHTYHGNPVARVVLGRMLSWATVEAAQSAARRRGTPQPIAGLYSGVHFQRAFYEHPEFRDTFQVVPMAELPALPLDHYAALWIPRESNQTMLMAQRDRLRAYLDAGGTVVSFEQVNRPWLPRASWSSRSVDVATLSLSLHPLVAGLTDADVRWHGHGAFTLASGAEAVIQDSTGDALLYLDECSWPGRVLAGTLDPDCHAGFGSGRTLPLLRRIVAWATAPAPALVG